jgi:hypothetical protein
MNLIRILVSAIAAIVGLILATPLLLLAIPLWIVSMLTRGVFHLVEPPFLNYDQLIQFDPAFGWKPRPNLNTHHLIGDVFRIKTDADGWRGNATLQESEIVVIGDSFAAGYGVGERHFFANLYRRPKIKPIGIGGYNMVQELLWMKHLASQLQGKLIVWFIYYENDLYDNLSPDLRGFLPGGAATSYRKPFVRELGQGGDWEIVSSHIRRAQWPFLTLTRLDSKLAELCSDTFLAQRAYSACAYLIRSGKQVCEEAGADLLVMTIPEACQLTPEGQSGLKARGGDPRSFDPYLPDKRIEDICEKLEVPFVAGKSFLDVNCYLKNDCHWNALGHRKVATALAQLYASRPIRRIGLKVKLDRTTALSGQPNATAKSAA